MRKVSFSENQNHVERYLKFSILSRLHAHSCDCSWRRKNVSSSSRFHDINILSHLQR